MNNGAYVTWVHIYNCLLLLLLCQELSKALVKFGSLALFCSLTWREVSSVSFQKLGPRSYSNFLPRAKYRGLLLEFK